MMTQVSQLRTGSLVHIPSAVSLVARCDEGYAYEIVKTEKPTLCVYVGPSLTEQGCSVVLHAGRKWEAFSNAIYPIIETEK